MGYYAKVSLHLCQKNITMPVNRNTLLRMRTIDGCLRRRHRSWTIEDLRSACEDALYEYEGTSGVSLRTIQRDIELMRSDKLGYNAPIEVVDRKYYRYADPDYSISSLPLTHEELSELTGALDILSQYSGFRGLSGLDETLTRIEDRIRSGSEGQQQVVFLDTNEQLKGLELLSPLYKSIVNRRALRVRYCSFRSGREIEICLSPYLLKEYNNRWFLLGHERGHSGILTLALDRMVGVEEDKEGRYKENIYFDPVTYLDDMVGVTRDLTSERERVVLWVDACQAPYVLTKPLHPRQELMEERKDGSIVVAIEVICNLELERLILGFGSHISVLSPKRLRDRIARQVMMMVTRYKE